MHSENFMLALRAASAVRGVACPLPALPVAAALVEEVFVFEPPLPHAAIASAARIAAPITAALLSMPTGIAGEWLRRGNSVIPLLSALRDPVRMRSVIARLRFSQMTVRWRLTVLYGGLFLGSGALLLLVTYLLVAHAGIIPPPKLAPGVKWPPAGRGGTPFSILFGRQRIANLDALIVDSAIALAGMRITPAQAASA
jgi:hypothetical protein